MRESLSIAQATRIGSIAKRTLGGWQQFGSREYSKEELIAEMGAAFLSTECGISQATIDDSASYIGSWIKHLRADPKLVVHAAAKAQKAVDLILNRHSSN